MSEKGQIAKIILQQLGGNKFVTMTGAKDLIAGEDYLGFKLPSRFAKDGVNYIKVTLNASDTYTMMFQKWNWAKGKCLFAHEHEDVYCEDLQRIFTSETGLCTHF